MLENTTYVIKSIDDYNNALYIIGVLFDIADDTTDKQLNNLISVLGDSIEQYENSLDDLINFELEASQRLT